MTNDIDRRAFLKATGTAAMALGLSQLRLAQATPRSSPTAATFDAGAAAAIEYRSFEDIYRAKWTWDSVAKSTHFVNCWYQRNCSWNAYVKSGMVCTRASWSIRPIHSSSRPRACWHATSKPKRRGWRRPKADHT